MRIQASKLTTPARQALIDWLSDQGLDPGLISDNGRFSVYNGRISGHRFLTPHTPPTPHTGKAICDDKRRPVTVPFNVPQLTDLPEALLV